MKRTKPKPKPYIDKNPIESVRNIGGSVVKSVGSDVVKGMTSDVWKQFLGFGESEKQPARELSGDLNEGQELDLTNLRQTQPQKEEVEKPTIQGGIDYVKEIIHGEKKIIYRHTQEMSAKIQEIIVELKRLASTSKELQIEFKEAAIEQRVSNPGKYHISFFEWMLSVIKQARMKVEDSGAWLAASKGKHAKKQQYWNLFRKHGTSFGLSSERIVATQTG